MKELVMAILELEIGEQEEEAIKENINGCRTYLANCRRTNRKRQITLRTSLRVTLYTERRDVARTSTISGNTL
jgi:hypothetical protein